MLESCEESSQWLNRSQLFFLTQLMVKTQLMTPEGSHDTDRNIETPVETIIVLCFRDIYITLNNPYFSLNFRFHIQLGFHL